MKLLFLCFSLVLASNAWAAQQSPQGALEPARQSPRVDTYDELVHEVRAVRRVSKERVEKAVEQEKVREAWEIGKLIDEHILLHKQRADYGKQVLKRLSGDISISVTEIQYMLEFYRAYPTYPHAGKLTWSEYRELLSVNDPVKRKSLADEAAEKNWSRSVLRREIQKLKGKDLKATPASQAETPLVPLKGRLDTYRIVIATVGPWKGKPALDLGFSNYYNHPSLKLERFKEGDIVTVVGVGARRAVPLLSGNATPADLFTYRAYPFKITDGDTLWVLVDLGFGFVTQQHLRLRGIDAPEIESAEGREAQAFLEKKLRVGARRAVPLLVIRTAKSDKYDRYLADLWVGETYNSAGNDKVSADSTWLSQARYVNQELINQGLAVRVTD